MYFVCVILFCYIIANTAAGGLDPRSVNLNLETVLQFDPNDNSADVKFIDNIRNILGKVKTVIDNKPARRSHRRPESIKFIDFIRNTIDVLKTYSDEDLKDAINVIDNEIRKYHYKGCKFHELVQNGELRRYVARKLSTVQNQDGKYIKKSLTNVLDALDDAKYDYKHVELLDYINSLYRQNDISKMKSFLNQIKAYKVKSKRANLDLIRIFRNGIRSLIFDHYSNLNPNARKELRFKIESFWHRDKEAATTKKKFDIANGFNFLRDFAFEFITPDTYTTKTTEYTTKPTESSQSIEEVIDMTRQKAKESPEVMPNYSDSEVTEEKTTTTTTTITTTTEKPKKKEKKKDKHKKKKELKRKKTHVTVAYENLTPKRKHKSKKHKEEPVFRQHNARPINLFDYKAAINVRAQTDESDSNEVWKPNENISSDRDKLKSKKFRPRDFRKTNVQDSEEGLSIDFVPSPLHLSPHTERTTKADDVLQRRLNNLEKVAKTFKIKVDNDETEETNATTKNVREKLTTVETTATNKTPATKRQTPTVLSYVQNTATIPTWEKLEQKVRDIETVTKIRKPLIQDSSATETTIVWKQSYKSINNYENKLSETTEKISITTPNVIDNQYQYNANMTNQVYYRTNRNESNEVLQRSINAPNTTSISEENEIENDNNFDNFLGKYNMSISLLNDFKENFNNITILTTNDIPTTYRADNNSKIISINNKENSTRSIDSMTDVSDEDGVKIDKVRRKLQQDMENMLAIQNGDDNNGNKIASNNF